MHPRNPYAARRPDFAELGREFPEFGEYLFVNAGGSPTIDFKKPDASRELTRTLLARDFDLRVRLSEDRLCPAVPNRIDYLLWCLDIVAASREARTRTGERDYAYEGTGSHCTPSFDHEDTVNALDIGTGAVAIYPLLGCRMSPNLQFVATDIDDDSLSSASANVSTNALTGRVRLVRVDPNGPIFAPDIFDGKQRVDFSMCNPPFYSSVEDMEQSAERKQLGANAVCTGAQVEMITPGGEVAFVKRMIDESMELKDRVSWFTSLVGKLSTVSVLIEHMRSHGIDNYGITELVQGVTKRWAVVWSFGLRRLPDSLTQIRSRTLSKHLPPTTVFSRTYSTAPSVEILHRQLLNALNGIDDVEVPLSSLPESGSKPSPSVDEQYAPDWERSDIAWVQVSVWTNTWSRAARRAKARAVATGEEAPKPQTSPEGKGPLLRCRFWIRDGKGSRSDVSGGSMPIQEAGEPSRGLSLFCWWTEGADRAAFESFFSHVTRRLGDVLRAKRAREERMDAEDEERKSGRFESDLH